MPIDRRRFLAAAAALALPGGALAQGSGEVDIVVIGAGAAGIAAARRIAAANRRCVVVEASDRIGGRCATDTKIFGMPFDRGAHWLYGADVNPVAKLGPGTGLDVYAAPPGQKVRIGRRYAREGELEDFLSVMVRTNRAIIEAARGKADVSCLQALPKDLLEWRNTVEFMLGPLPYGKDLRELSAVDVSKAAERDSPAYCREGLGALLGRLAGGLAVRLSTPATRINTWVRGKVEVETTRGTIVARGAIITASTNVMAAGKIRFDPELPKRQLDAFSRLSLGSQDHVVLELAGQPLGPQADDLIFEKADSARTAAMLANVSGTPLCMIQLGGKLGRDLAAQGEAAMVDYAQEWLAKLYGSDIRKAVRRTHATRWNQDPWVMGAASAASIGGQGSRAALTEPVRDRIWFAGEAVHETQWGTVGGAWLSGERAAEAAMRKFGWITTPRPSGEPAREPTRKPRRQPAPTAAPAVQPPTRSGLHWPF
ncbi:flavin monoamine oxidase family protein [Rhodoplanes roseus]|uniref:Tryptophan 2-monooxygenase n=1 Tax=Rhodoplanes roseus TaxID=29409 RepID=A0A327L2N1_9BRAD|nr:NAD(P)/FAD-dependent oxidoreductase [Rhodoplanes roseus]RAI45199.1 amine oxidase [Rhodoplanes roseus]